MMDQADNGINLLGATNKRAQDDGGCCFLVQGPNHSKCSSDRPEQGYSCDANTKRPEFCVNSRPLLISPPPSAVECQLRRWFA